MSTSEENSRRRFLRTGTLLSAALITAPSLTRAGIVKTAVSNHTTISRVEEDLPIINRKRTLGTGKASMEVSALGFGVMGMTYNRGTHPGKKETIKLLRQAVDHGFTLFDTAEIYGPFNNEELAGEALSAYKDKVYVTTKFGHEIVAGKATGKVNSRPEHVKKVAEESLRRLRIESIPLFYQHRYDPDVPIEEVAGAIADLMKEGKVQRWGLCEVNAAIIRRAHTVQPLTAIQSEYHLMWREPEKEVIPVCEELGIGFVPYSPINRGFLGGTINEYTRLGPHNDNRAALPRFTSEALRANYRIVEILNTFGRSRGVTSAQLALAWLLYRKPWVVPIPGTTKISHLEENLRSADIDYTPTEWKELEQAIASIPIIGERYNAEEQKKVSN